jgi:hypothetical protein
MVPLSGCIERVEALARLLPWSSLRSGAPWLGMSARSSSSSPPSELIAPLGSPAPPPELAEPLDVPRAAPEDQAWRGGADVRFTLRLERAPQTAPPRAGTVSAEDRLQLDISAREAAHVYVAYCSAAGRLTWFPHDGSLVVAPGAPVVAPEPGAWLAFDDAVGWETLYAVVSRRPLATADPALVAAMERTRGSGHDVDCEAAIAPAAGAKGAGAPWSAVMGAGAGRRAQKRLQRPPPPAAISENLHAATLPPITHVRGAVITREPLVRESTPVEMTMDADGIAVDRKSTRLNSSHNPASRMPSSA